jgi:hypothetical protein
MGREVLLAHDLQDALAYRPTNAGLVIDDA